MKSEGNKKINKFIKLGIISFVSIFAFLISVNDSSAAEITPGTAYVTYGDGASISWATLTTQSGFGATIGTLSSISLSKYGTPLWIKTATSPTRKEILLGDLDTNGKFNILRHDGTAWSLDWTENKVGSNSLDNKAFGIAYETSSKSNGEAVVAWARTKGTTGGTDKNIIEYKVWNGTSWGASASYTLTEVRASISFMEMYSHPASSSNQSDIVLCYSAGKGNTSKTTAAPGATVGCVVWDGATNTWGNEKLLESDAIDGVTNAKVGEVKVFSGFFEQGAGDFVAVTGVGATTVTSAVWDGSSWTATSSFTVSDAPHALSCAPMPYLSDFTNNHAVCMYSDVTALDTGSFEWDGSALANNNGNIDINGGGAIAADSLDSTWLINGSNRLGTSIYPEAATAWDFVHWNDGTSGWTEVTTGPSTAAAQKTLRWVSSPGEKQKSTVLVVDANSDLQIYKASISGTTFSWGTVKTNATLDLATSTKVPADLQYYSFASPTFTHFRWYQDDAAPGSATALAAEDIKASGSAALASNTTYRLRTQISNEGPASISSDLFRLQFTKANTSCYNGGKAAGWDWRTIPLTTAVASDAFEIEDSGSFTDGDAITGNTLTASDPNFKGGAAYDAVATSSAWLLNGNQYTELEWNIKPTNAVVGSSYCFRVGLVTDGSTTPDTIGSMSYSKIASASIQAGQSTTYTQNDYQWYYNVDNIDPTGSAAVENTTTEIVNTQPMRLRVNLDVNGSTMAQNTQKFKLKYATAVGGPYYDVGATTSTDTWKYYENPSVAHGTTLTTTKLGDTTVLELYMASNSMPTNPNSATTAAYIEYDFSLNPTRATPNTTWYFRVYKSDDSALTAYTNTPTLSVVPTGQPAVVTGGGGGASSNGDQGGGTPQGGGAAHGGNGGSGGSEGGGQTESGGDEGGGGGESPVIFDWRWVFNSLFNWLTNG
jgi:hypothetical protein